MCGHPLISYSIYAAKKSKLISNLIISTDSLKIKKICENYGASVPFLRPKKLAKDHIWSRGALKHAVLKSENIYNEKYDFILHSDATWLKLQHYPDNCKKWQENFPRPLLEVTKVFFCAPEAQRCWGSWSVRARGPCF